MSFFSLGYSNDNFASGNAIETCKENEFNCGGGRMCIPIEKACDGNVSFYVFLHCIFYFIHTFICNQI